MVPSRRLAKYHSIGQHWVRGLVSHGQTSILALGITASHARVHIVNPTGYPKFHQIKICQMPKFADPPNLTAARFTHYMVLHT